MIHLFRGEVYRILHKRSMYRYLAVVFLGVLAITFMRSSGLNADSVVDDAGTLFQLMPALLGGYFFTSIFSDDLTSKNLITLVGYGTSRTKIIITKLLLMLVFTFLSFAVLTGLHLAAYALLGFAATGPAIGYVLAFALQNLLLTIGFTAVAAIVVYGTQRPTFAAVAYFMLAFNVVTMLIRAVSGLLDVDLSSRLISGTAGDIMMGLLVPGGVSAAPWIEFAAYLALAIGAAIFVFKRREMEF